MTSLHIGFLGDMGEGVRGQYPSQLWETDLDVSDQTEIVSAAELVILRELAPYFAKTDVVAVPGNHTRNVDDYDTGTHDVGDMTSYRYTARLLKETGEADNHNISFYAPEKHAGANFARVEVGGTRVLWAHGHQKRGKADALRSWWKDVSFSRWGDADSSDILITGHRHHTRIEEVAKDRWFMVCPTLGGDSTYFHDDGGPTSQPGTLHFTTEGAKVYDIAIAWA